MSFEAKLTFFNRKGCTTSIVPTIRTENSSTSKSFCIFLIRYLGIKGCLICLSYANGKESWLAERNQQHYMQIRVKKNLHSVYENIGLLVSICGLVPIIECVSCSKVRLNHLLASSVFVEQRTIEQHVVDCWRKGETEYMPSCPWYKSASGLSSFHDHTVNAELSERPNEEGCVRSLLTCESEQYWGTVGESTDSLFL